MSEDIGPGDVVVCVDGRETVVVSARYYHHSRPPPRESVRYVVTDYWVDVVGTSRIMVAGCPNVHSGTDRGWAIIRFRKAGPGDHAQSILNTLKVDARPKVTA